MVHPAAALNPHPSKKKKKIVMTVPGPFEVVEAEGVLELVAIGPLGNQTGENRQLVKRYDSILWQW